MGATPSVQRDAKSPEDAPEDAQDGENLDDKVTLLLNCYFVSLGWDVLTYVVSPFGTS